MRDSSREVSDGAEQRTHLESGLVELSLYVRARDDAGTGPGGQVPVSEKTRAKRDREKPLAFGVHPADAARVPTAIGFQAIEYFLRTRSRRSADSGRRMHGTREVEHGGRARANAPNARVQMVAFRESARHRAIGGFEIAHERCERRANVRYHDAVLAELLFRRGERSGLLSVFVRRLPRATVPASASASTSRPRTLSSFSGDDPRKIDAPLAMQNV